MTHCDDLIDDKDQPAALRAFLDFNRLPAMEQFQKLGEEGFEPPVLFATVKNPIERMGDTSRVLNPGKTVRVVMASRFGDVGVSRDFKKEHGYCARTDLENLEDFRSSKK